jgi:hypothetical protein
MGPCTDEGFAQICKPVAERTRDVGCWIIAHQSVGQLNKPETFWQLDVYATRAEAEAAKTAGSVVVESLGKMWLVFAVLRLRVRAAFVLTIADKGWRPPGGERIAEIGPLPITAGQTYSAQYMEAIFTPGMTAPAHTHELAVCLLRQGGYVMPEDADANVVKIVIHEDG